MNSGSESLHAKSLRRRSEDLQRRLESLGVSVSTKGLVNEAVENVIAVADDAYSEGKGTWELGVYRTLHQSVRRLLVERKDGASNALPNADADILQAINKTVTMVDALLLKLHGKTKASKQAVDLLDPIAQGFVTQFFQEQTIQPVVLAQQMVQVSLAIRHDSSHLRTSLSWGRQSSQKSLQSSITSDSSYATPLQSETFITSWRNFDVLEFATRCDAEEASVGPLEKLSMELFEHFDLFKTLPLKRSSVKRFLADIEVSYRDNDYHNGVHAADVTQAAAYFIESSLQDQIEPIHIFALLLSAVVHDVGHPGLNNAYLVARQTDVAERWNNVSVNENGHLYTANTLLKQYDVLKDFADDDRVLVLKLLQKMVLCTDMEVHADLVKKVIEAVEREFDKEAGLLKPVKEWGEVWIPLAFALHCADISNPARPYDLALYWANAIVEEFFKQGDLQRGFQMSVPGFMDRRLASPAGTQSSQLGFIKVIVKPSLELLDSYMPQAAAELLSHIETNIERYEDDVNKALMIDTRTV
ncbi:cyclic GMP phosphodiesterase [Ostreococcus tauri]|uniref:Phosphodiesterase n=1 Tax=Ostreococcus tauri TaxID=70448 RepID=A0A1Y5I9T1_OSTTA|nr:cyclic GMP phosphodiesterase [Ostreococcus tauri]